MQTLKARLERIMLEHGWDHAQLMRVTGQSSSAVSQWLGKGSKEIKSIGSLEAALRLADATGYHALWLAEGKGPPKPYAAPALPDPAAPTRAAEPGRGYLPASRTLDDLRALLSSTAAPMRPAVAELLSAWALSGGAENLTSALCALIGTATPPATGDPKTS